jgi:DNA primase
MRIPESLVQEIILKNPIEDVISQYTSLVPKGDRLWGLSPFKPEKTPSFTVSPDKGLYYCFSTQKGGGVIQFVMELEKLTFPEALEFLAQRAGIELKGVEKDTESIKRKALEELYQKITHAFNYLLQEKSQGKRALEYLYSRKLSHDTIQTYQLGYAPEDPYWLHSFLKTKGYSDDFLETTGLFSKKNPRWGLFSGRIIFPIHDGMGKVVGFGGRIFEGDGPKYLNSPESVLYKKSQLLYGFYQAKQSIREGKKAILCEGYMDVLSLHQAGVSFACAPLGTAFTSGQAEILKRYVREIQILFDSDTAGTDATLKAIALLEDLEVESKVISLVDSKDPGELLEKSGSQALANAVYSLSNALNYILDTAVSKHDMSTPSGKAHGTEQLFSYVKHIKSAVKRDAALEFSADRLGILTSSLREDFSTFVSNETNVRGQFKSSSSNSQQTLAKKKTIPLDLKGPELFLMTFVALHHEEFARIRTQFLPEDFQNILAKELFLIMEDLFREGNLRTDTILSRIEKEELQQYVTQKEHSGEFSQGYRELLEETMYRVKFEINKRKRADVDNKIRIVSLQKNNDQHTIEELIKEKMYLDQEFLELKVILHDRTAE